MTTKYKNREREILEAVQACFLTERLTDWPVPTVRVNPDTLTHIVQSALHRIAEESIAAVVLDEKSVGSMADLTGIEKTREIYRVAGWNSARAHILEARDKYFGNV